MDNKQIGENIRSMRLANDMTQEQLAQKLGYKSRSTINKIEMGINSIHPTKILAFAKALDTTPAYLLGLSAVPKKLVKSVEICFDDKTLVYFFNEENILKVKNFLDDLEKKEKKSITDKNIKE